MIVAVNFTSLLLATWVSLLSSLWSLYALAPRMHMRCDPSACNGSSQVAGHGVPMGRSGTGAFPPSMISLFSLGDVLVLHADAVAAHGIRYHFSHRLFLAAFSVIPVEISFRFSR